MTSCKHSLEAIEHTWK